MAKRMDVIGFGTYKLLGDDCYNAILKALAIGYRTFDTAILYKNHNAIGRAITDSGIPRDQIFITSKVHRKYINKGNIIDAIYVILRELGVDYIDLLLLHEPYKHKDINVANAMNIKNWKQMEDIQQRKLAINIGVSNFRKHELVNILNTGVKPYVNQIEVSPFVTRDDLVKFCTENGIIVQAYRSLVNGERNNDNTLVRVASELNISVCQLLLCWSIAKGYYVIPCTSNEDHMKENFNCPNVFDLSELDSLDSLNCLNTDTYTLPQHAD